MISPTEKLHPKIDVVIQWHTQAGNITTNLDIKINFTLTELSATKTVTRNCHVDYCDKSIYDTTLCRDLLT